MVVESKPRRLPIFSRDLAGEEICTASSICAELMLLDLFSIPARVRWSAWLENGVRAAGDSPTSVGSFGLRPAIYRGQQSAPLDCSSFVMPPQKKERRPSGAAFCVLPRSALADDVDHEQGTKHITERRLPLARRRSTGRRRRAASATRHKRPPLPRRLPDR